MSREQTMLGARLDAPGVISAYNRIAPIYDLWGRLAETRAHELCLDWLDLEDVGLVLDVATGTGALLGKVLEKAPRARGIGVDLSPGMLRRAAVRSNRAGCGYDLLRGDARSLPIRSGVVDLVINSYMFDLLPESEFTVVLDEFARVMAPRGRLALINMTLADRAAERIWETVYRVHPPLLGGCRGVKMTAPLTQAGFLIERQSRVSQFGFPSEIVLARLSPGKGVPDVERAP